MIRTGIRDSYYRIYGFDEGIRKIKAHGYDGIDYQAFVNTNNTIFHKTPHEFKVCMQEKYKKIADLGLIVHQVHGPWRWPVQDTTKEERAERFEKMSRSIEGAAILGSKYMVIHPLMPYGIDDKGHEKDTWEINQEFFGRLCQVGREHGVVICLENMPFVNLSISAVPEVLRFVQNMNDDYVKVCLDTGHCAIHGGDLAEAVRILGKKYLQTLHIHDNDGKQDCHAYPFDGLIDWRDFAKSLFEIDFDGVLSLEVQRKSVPEETRENDEIELYGKIRSLAKLAKGIVT